MFGDYLFTSSFICNNILVWLCFMLNRNPQKSIRQSIWFWNSTIDINVAINVSTKSKMFIKSINICFISNLRIQSRTSAFRVDKNHLYTYLLILAQAFLNLRGSFQNDYKPLKRIDSRMGKRDKRTKHVGHGFLVNDVEGCFDYPVCHKSCHLSLKE